MVPLPLHKAAEQVTPGCTQNKMSIFDLFCVVRDKYCRALMVVCVFLWEDFLDQQESLFFIILSTWPSDPPFQSLHKPREGTVAEGHPGDSADRAAGMHSLSYSLKAQSSGAAGTLTLWCPLISAPALP